MRPRGWLRSASRAIRLANSAGSGCASPRAAWIGPGTHVDLIGAYKADMREADDALISGGTLFVDSRETTIDHIGELTIPIASGVITADAVRGDLYDLVHGHSTGRSAEGEITLYKNGGGAHMDLMIARYISEKAC